MEFATEYPSNKNALEVLGSLTKTKEMYLLLNILKCIDTWDFSNFILFPFIGAFNSINKGNVSMIIIKSGKPELNLFSIFWIKSVLFNDAFICLKKFFSLDMLIIISHN